MSIIEFISWSVAIIFALTGVITLLSLIGLIKIDKEYERRLFYGLIIEIIAVSVFVFRDYIINYSESTKWNFTSFTTPHFDLNQATDILKIDSTWKSLLVNGVVQFDKTKNLEPWVILEMDSAIVFKERVAINNKGIFKLNIPREHFTNNSNFELKLQIIGNQNIIKEDIIKGIIYKP